MGALLPERPDGKHVDAAQPVGGKKSEYDENNNENVGHGHIERREFDIFKT